MAKYNIVTALVCVCVCVCVCVGGCVCVSVCVLWVCVYCGCVCILGMCVLLLHSIDGIGLRMNSAISPFLCFLERWK